MASFPAFKMALFSSVFGAKTMVQIVDRKAEYLRSWIHWRFSVHRHQFGPGWTTKIMSDSSDSWSSEDEDCPGEYDPDGVVYVHLPLDDDHFHLNDAPHTTWSNTAKSLKEFNWIMSAIATFISLLAGCYNRFTHSSFSLLTHICGVVAACLMAWTCSPASTINSVHQWMAGGVAGARFHPSSSWRCSHGHPLSGCSPNCCCTRCTKTLTPNNPAVVGYKARRLQGKVAMPC